MKFEKNSKTIAESCLQLDERLDAHASFLENNKGMEADVPRRSQENMVTLYWNRSHALTYGCQIPSNSTNMFYIRPSSFWHDGVITGNGVIDLPISLLYKSLVNIPLSFTYSLYMLGGPVRVISELVEDIFNADIDPREYRNQQFNETQNDSGLPSMMNLCDLEKDIQRKNYSAGIPLEELHLKLPAHFPELTIKKLDKSLGRSLRRYGV